MPSPESPQKRTTIFLIEKIPDFKICCKDTTKIAYMQVLSSFSPNKIIFYLFSTGRLAENGSPCFSGAANLAGFPDSPVGNYVLVSDSERIMLHLIYTLVYIP
jgi:hypothetical protein